MTLFEATQLPALQNPLLQSASTVQPVLQLAPVVLHWYTPQELGVPATQAPVPLQAGTGSKRRAVQAATPQVVPAAHLRQAPAPSQKPSLPQEVAVSAVQSLRTSVPETAGVHCPRVPTPPQVMQAPLQAFSQQTPSTQKPLWQSPVEPQAVPFVSCATQCPPEQKLPVVQSLFEVHEVAQDVEPHMYGAQEAVVAARQVPAPSHVRGSVSVEPLHVSLVQPVPAA